jgi:hypothetical protein
MPPVLRGAIRPTGSLPSAGRLSRRFALAAGTFILILAGAAASVAAAPRQEAAQAPTSPPIRVCDNPSLLTGPTSAPRGALTVHPTDDLPHLVLNHRSHTTFWLSPGTYTFGDNKFDQVIPKAGDRFIGAPGAVIDGRHKNLFAFTQHAPNVTIEYLAIENFGGPGDNNNQGVVNHDSGTGWVIEHDTIKDNAGAGVMLGSNDVLSYNCLTSNGQYGFSAYQPKGVHHLLVSHNEISFNDTYDWERALPGCGCAGGAKFWNVDGAIVNGNYVHGNESVGLWVDTDNTGFDISDNYISDSYNEGLIYEISYNARIADNTFVGNGLHKGPATPSFPTGAVYISESGSSTSVGGPYGTSFAVTGNLFINNWSGVILWENANRFCGSPYASATYCTLVSPKVANVRTCDRANLEGSHPRGSPDYFSLCRWKTQNVSVSDNTFDFDPSAVGQDCKATNGCGFNGIFSEYGSDPSWSPYHGTVVEDAITSHQNNHFRANKYMGPWRFMVHELGHAVSFDTWRHKWSQDLDSTYSAS